MNSTGNQMLDDFAQRKADTNRRVLESTATIVGGDLDHPGSLPHRRLQLRTWRSEVMIAFPPPRVSIGKTNQRRTMKISKLITAAALSVGMLSGIVATAGAASASTASASPVVYGAYHGTLYAYSNLTPAWTHAIRRPPMLVLSGDGGFSVSSIDWSNMSYQGTKLQWWGPNSAQGFGTVRINECVPNCAQSYRYITLTDSIISMWRVRYHVGQPYYTRLEVWGVNNAVTRYWDINHIVGAHGIGNSYSTVWGQPLPGNGVMNHVRQIRQGGPLVALASSYIHPGAFCSVHGQHGVSKTHKSYWCEPKGGHDRWEPTR